MLNLLRITTNVWINPDTIQCISRNESGYRILFKNARYLDILPYEDGYTDFDDYMESHKPVIIPKN